MLFLFKRCQPNSRDCRPGPGEHVMLLVLAESAVPRGAGGQEGEGLLSGSLYSFEERPTATHATHTPAAMERLVSVQMLNEVVPGRGDQRNVCHGCG